VDYTPFLRSALENLRYWVVKNAMPPPSSFPSIDEGTAVEPEKLKRKFEKLKGVHFPENPLRVPRLDFGPEAHKGILNTLPPKIGPEYPLWVSDIDEDCNEITGIRLSEVSVPLATHTGWNLRHQRIGCPELLIGVTGGLEGWSLPFCATKIERERQGDPRLSIEERYESRDSYMDLVRREVNRLVELKYLLAEDVDGIIERSALAYDLFTAGADGKNSGAVSQDL
jgi:hypothetical protein